MKQFIQNLMRITGLSYLWKIIKQLKWRQAKEPTKIIQDVEEQPQKQVSASEHHKYDGVLIFALDKNGKVDILYDWSVKNSKSAERYAELLYRVNAGMYEKQIMEHLLSINSSPVIVSFIKKIIFSWSSRLQDIRPAVRPMTIFRSNAQSAQGHEE